MLDFPASLHVTSFKEAGKWNEAEGGEKPLLLHRCASFVAKACPRRLRPMPFLRESEAVETLESQSDEAARREPAKSVRLKRNGSDY
ncbi:hypothetical protein AC739_13125 [Planococcus glaciei]|nr:hypothetical protein AC739_13125 [Planococcus glaciei]